MLRITFTCCEKNYSPSIICQRFDLFIDDIVDIQTLLLDVIHNVFIHIFDQVFAQFFVHFQKEFLLKISILNFIFDLLANVAHRFDQCLSMFGCHFRHCYVDYMAILLWIQIQTRTANCNRCRLNSIWRCSKIKNHIVLFARYSYNVTQFDINSVV